MLLKGMAAKCEASIGRQITAKERAGGTGSFQISSYSILQWGDGAIRRLNSGTPDDQGSVNTKVANTLCKNA
jgi:hypothetical protein